MLGDELDLAPADAYRAALRPRGDARERLESIMLLALDDPYF